MVPPTPLVLMWGRPGPSVWSLYQGEMSTHSMRAIGLFGALVCQHLKRPKNDHSDSIRVVKSVKRRNVQTKWWFTIMTPPGILGQLEASWPASSSWSHYTCPHLLLYLPPPWEGQVMIMLKMILLPSPHLNCRGRLHLHPLLLLHNNQGFHVIPLHPLNLFRDHPQLSPSPSMQIGTLLVMPLHTQTSLSLSDNSSSCPW